MVKFAILLIFIIMLKSKVPLKLLPFLTTQKSLTKKLESLSKKPLMVKVLSQKVRPMTLLEKKLCCLPLHRPILAWERQVLLFGNDEQAWVQASSLFPYDSLKGGNKRLKHLKNIPIGYFLFKKNIQLPCQRQFIQHNQNIGRQNIYQINNQPILIQEIFLDAFCQFLSQNQIVISKK